MDAAFIFLWIAFDCSYGSKRQGERPAMRTFFHEVLRRGRDQIYDALWSRFAGPVRVLLSDEYLFQPHLDELSGAPTVRDWKEDLARRNDELQNRAQPYKDRTLSTLDGVVDRLYCLRNQLFHGGAKWGSTRNRESVRTGARSWLSSSPCSLGSCWRRGRTSGWASRATTWKARVRRGWAAGSTEGGLRALDHIIVAVALRNRGSRRCDESVGRATRFRGHFPNDRGATKLIYLALRGLRASGAGRRRTGAPAAR